MALNLVALWLSKPHEIFIFPLVIAQGFFSTADYLGCTVLPCYNTVDSCSCEVLLLPRPYLQVPCSKQETQKQKDTKQTNIHAGIFKNNWWCFYLVFEKLWNKFFSNLRKSIVVCYHGLFWFGLICFHWKHETNINLFSQAHFF